MVIGTSCSSLSVLYASNLGLTLRGERNVMLSPGLSTVRVRVRVRVRIRVREKVRVRVKETRKEMD
jgi:hypothetical protein